MTKREIAHKLDGHRLVVEQIGACVSETRVSREAADVEAASLRGNNGRSVLTFKNDTEGALADLLAYAIVYADDVSGGGRGVGVRGHGRTVGLTARSWRGKREGQRPDVETLAVSRCLLSLSALPGRATRLQSLSQTPSCTRSSPTHEDVRHAGWIMGMVWHVTD